MKIFSIIGALAAAAGWASCQSLSSLPVCGAQAALQAIQQAGCPITNVPCICSKISALDALRSNIIAKCSPEDQALALKFQNELCGGTPGQPREDAETGEETAAEEGGEEEEEEGEEEEKEEKEEEDAADEEKEGEGEAATEAAEEQENDDSRVGAMMTAAADATSTPCDSSSASSPSSTTTESEAGSGDGDASSSAASEFTGGALPNGKPIVMTVVVVMVVLAVSAF